MEGQWFLGRVICETQEDHISCVVECMGLCFVVLVSAQFSSRDFLGAVKFPKLVASSGVT